jgi:TolB-like protein/DNA-binding winged helix-turn-helix (wHTH) protein/Tfp pilus assembly protein PilF
MSLNEEQKTPDAGKLKMGSLVIDRQTRTVSSGDQILDLPDLSWRLLEALIRHAPNRVTKDQLIEEVWQGTVVSDETLTQRIKLLRKALPDDDKQRYIISIRNQGYRLRLPVSANSSGPGKAARSNLILLVAIGGLVIIALAAVIIGGPWKSREPAPESFQSLAVLPFENLSEEPDFRYFADGIHEELLTRLSRIEGLDVVSRTSVLPYRSSSLPITEIALQLGVDAVLEGSVQRAGNQVRITTQLIDGQTDHHLWAETFDRQLSMENLFAIQSEVAVAVTGALELELPGNSRSHLVELPTNNLEAYDLYLLGRFHTFQLTAENLQQAVDLLSHSVTLDREFAAAWAGLGWAYSFQGSGYTNLAPAEVYEQAREAALRALSLDSELADAHALYADILTWYDWDWEAAEREFRATLKLDPYNALGYALFLSTQLRHSESLELIENLIRRFPGNEFLHINAAWRYFNARQYDKALEQAELARNHVDYGSVVGWALLSSGRHGDALELFREELQAQPQNPSRISNLAVAHARMGNTQQSTELLSQLTSIESLQYVGADLIAAVYFELGEDEAGFEWLQKALQQRSRGLIFMQVDHVYDYLRTDPRYLALAAQVGF